MKKILFWAIAIMLVMSMIGAFTFTGCKVAEEAAPVEEVEEAEEEEMVEEDERPYEGQTISYLAYPWLTLSPEVIQKFTDLTGIIVETETLGFKELNIKTVTSSTAGIAPADVFAQYVGHLGGLVGAGFVEPLDDYVSDELLEDLLAVSSFTFDEKIMGMPLYYNVYTCIYNTEKLAAAGFDEPPKTMEELVEVCLKIKELGIEEYPMLFDLAAGTGTSKNWFQLTFAYGGELFDMNYQPLFVSEDSEGYKALKFLVDNVGVIIDPAMLETIGEQRGEIFRAGRGTFELDGFGALAGCENPERSTISNSVAPMLVPGTEDDRSGTMDIADGIVISSLSENKDAAWEFIEWWLSDDTVIAAFKEQGVMPTRRSMLTAFSEQGLFEWGDFIGEQGSYSQPIYPAGIPSWDGAWQEEAGATINQAARGNITIMEALQNIANKALELQEQ